MSEISVESFEILIAKTDDLLVEQRRTNELLTTLCQHQDDAVTRQERMDRAMGVHFFSPRSASPIKNARAGEAPPMRNSFIGSLSQHAIEANPPISEGAATTSRTPAPEAPKQSNSDSK